MQIDNETLKNAINDINVHLEAALHSAQLAQSKIESIEGDSDLFRKFSAYLIPSLDHWMKGLQAGNIKDLENVLRQRSLPVKKK